LANNASVIAKHSRTEVHSAALDKHIVTHTHIAEHRSKANTLEGVEKLQQEVRIKGKAVIELLINSSIISHVINILLTLRSTKLLRDRGVVQGICILAYKVRTLVSVRDKVRYSQIAAEVSNVTIPFFSLINPPWILLETSKNTGIPVGVN